MSGWWQRQLAWRDPRCKRPGCDHLWTEHRSYLDGARCRKCDCRRFRRWFA